MSRGIHPVMVGTAGHIDHGKSSLVRRLTGIDPDRLKEEKERGLTIDLGFAPLELRDGRRLGMVDVPGHERFVKNMVAGCTALDLSILVVAADDSVMPQTVEHLEILDLLGVQRGLIALTKIDLVDDDLAELATQEITELVEGTVLEGARIVPVSSTTGQGIDELRELLEEMALGVTPRNREGAFRMSLQRVFRLEGIGTVITGIPISGTVAPGDELEILPLGETVRVREVHAFGGRVERAVAGHSTALAVPDAKGLPLRRGQVAAAPGVFRAGEQIDVELRIMPDARPLQHRDPVRFHTGTAETLGVLSLLEGDVAEPGSTVLARILLEEPVACAHEDRFLLRSMNPVRAVGGGTVLQVGGARGYRRRRVAEEVRSMLEAGNDPVARITTVVQRGAARGIGVHEVATELSMEVDEVIERAEAAEGLVHHDRGRRLFLREVLDDGIRKLHESVARMLRDKPHAASVSRSSFRSTHEFPPELKDAAIDAAQVAGEVRSLPDGRVLFVQRLKPLAEEDQRQLDAMVTACAEAAFRVPTREELPERVGVDRNRCESLLARGLDEGRVQLVGDHVYPTATVRAALHAVRRNAAGRDGVLEIPALRDELDTSRKWLIPLLEYIDATGLTRLRGGERRLLATSDIARELAAEADAGGAQATTSE